MKLLSFLVGFILFYSSICLAQSADLLKCVNAINTDVQFSGVSHYPDNYYFSVVKSPKTKKINQFVLIGENQSYLCTTDSPLMDSSNIDINNNLPKMKKRLSYFHTAPQKFKPQKKLSKDLYVRNKSNYHLDKGYIIQHQSFETAIELTSDVTTSNRKNIARCERTKDEKLLDEGLVSIAKTEILDLTADWSEGLDYINTGYGYDKLKMKNDFEKKLQSVLEKCNQVDQLYSTTQKVYDRIGLKSDINLRSPANNKTKSKRSLPSRKKR